MGCAARELQGRCYRICMVSDCFYPDAGGVENHMITLAQCLILQVMCLGVCAVKFFVSGALSV